jgi:hypothetical protein
MVTASRTAVSVRSVDEAVNLTGEHKLFKLQKDGGQMNTAMIIAVMLSKMADDMHLKDGLTEGNIDDIVRRLTTDDDIRYWLTLADISLLCRRIAEGYYGKTYGRFGIAEFNECLMQYCNERRDIHKQQADKVVVNPTEASLTMKELGYTIGPDGNLIVPDEQKERHLPQPLYLFNDNGKRIGINPKGAFGKKQASKDKTDNVIFLVKQMMKDDRELSLDEAIDMAEAQINNQSTSNQP